MSGGGGRLGTEGGDVLVMGTPDYLTVDPGTEISRGSVQMEKFREVLWSSPCVYIEANRGKFILYSCPDW